MLDVNKPAVSVETVEVNAWRDLMAAMPEPVAKGLAADCSYVGGALSISARNVPLVTFNRTIGLGLQRPATRDDLAAIAAHFRQFSAPLAQLQIAPYVLSPDMEADLAATGFRRVPTRWAKMGRRSADGPKVETSLEAHLAGPEEAEAFAAAVVGGFGMPAALMPWVRNLVGRDGWRCYVIRDGASVIAGGAMYLDSDCAWLGMGATLPDARKQGAQSLLLARRIADAEALGKPWVFTETGILDGPNPSLANMRRAGFECLHERTNWVLGG
jgi:hypothetical protein